MGCVALNSDPPEGLGLTGVCRFCMEEWIAKEKAALAFTRGVGGEKPGKGNKVTFISFKSHR